MAKYNGHRSKAAWNVSIWINNEEPLYRLALDFVKKHGKNKAAEMLLERLPDETPDGYRYTKTSIREALRGIES